MPIKAHGIDFAVGLDEGFPYSSVYISHKILYGKKIYMHELYKGCVFKKMIKKL
jgi:hypothetical protein